jgi:hypothetical protein
MCDAQDWTTQFSGDTKVRAELGIVRVNFSTSTSTVSSSTVGGKAVSDDSSPHDHRRRLERDDADSGWAPEPVVREPNHIVAANADIAVRCAGRIDSG